jgi:hypothetical protein
MVGNAFTAVAPLGAAVGAGAVYFVFSGFAFHGAASS